MKTLKQLRKIQEADADNYVVDPDDDEEALEYQPRSDGEIEFVDLHSVEVSNHPAAPEDQHVAKTSHNKHKGVEHPGEPVVKQGTSGDVKFAKFREKITKTPLRKGDKRQGDFKTGSVKEEVELDEAKKVTEYKGIAYFKDHKDAKEHMKKFAPEGRVVEYGRGYAVQTRISGPYLNKSGKVSEEVELDEAKKVTEYKGIAYFKDRKDAKEHMKKFAPEGRVVEYERGYAVQTRISGPYLNKSGSVKEEVELDEAKKVTKKQLRDLEDRNEHGLVALKLAQSFGTPAEVKKNSNKRCNKRL